jgi:hypothetical protein
MPKMIELEEVQRLIGDGAQVLDVMSRKAARLDRAHGRRSGDGESLKRRGTVTRNDTKG